MVTPGFNITRAFADTFAKQKAQREAAAQGLANIQTPTQAAQTTQIIPNIDASRVNGQADGPNVTQGYYENYLGNNQNAALQAATEQRRLAAFSPMLDNFSTSLSGSNGNGGEVAPIADVSLPEQINLGQINAFEDAARNAQYARAKDTAGKQGRASLNALADVMGARGLSGSGIQIGKAGGIISEGASQLGDVNRTQQIEGLQNARDRASEAYQGAITQRGQDANNLLTQRGQNVAQRGQTQQANSAARAQNIQAYSTVMNPMMGLLTARY